MGTGECRRIVARKPIYDVFGSKKCSALINWHALPGCDTTGHIQEKGKKGCFTAFLNSSDSVVAATAGLGKDVEPSAEVVRGVKNSCVVFSVQKTSNHKCKATQMASFQTTKT